MSDITLVVSKKEKSNPEVFGKNGAYAQAYGLFNLSFALGALVGPLWGAFIKDAAGWSTLTWTLGLLSGISAIPTAIWCGGAIYTKNLA
jgi:MFS family permease